MPGVAKRLALFHSYHEPVHCMHLRQRQEVSYNQGLPGCWTSHLCILVEKVCRGCFVVYTLGLIHHLALVLQTKALQTQHEQAMMYLRSGKSVEMRRALHHQAVDLTRRHHTEEEWLERAHIKGARDQALLELQELQAAQSELKEKVRSEQTPLS